MAYDRQFTHHNRFYLGDRTNRSPVRRTTVYHYGPYLLTVYYVGSLTGGRCHPAGDFTAHVIDTSRGLR